MTETRYALLVNPVAGNGKGRFHFLKIKSELGSRGVLFDEFITEKAGDEILLFVNAVQIGYRNFIIIGGDGTLSKVIHAFLQSPDCNRKEFSFGVIPSGTGNDWCRHHRISNNPLKALEVILKGRTILHDAGIITSGNLVRYFINMAGTGFQGYVVKKITESGNQKSNRLFYYLKVLQYIFSYKPSFIRLQSEELQLYEPVFSIAAGICQYNGGGMMQAPGAVADDGLMDITIIKKMPILQLLINFPKISSGKHVRHPEVTVFRTRKLSVESAEMIYADADGELSFTSPFQFSILPNALPMFVP